MSGIQAALEYTNCMPSSKPLAAAATWLGSNARLKLSLNSWARGAAQKRDVLHSATQKSGSSLSHAHVRPLR